MRRSPPTFEGAANAAISGVFLGLGSERPTNLKKSPKIDFHSGTVPKFHHVSHHFDRVRSWGGLAPGLGLPPMTDGEPISFRPCQPRLHVPV